MTEVVTLARHAMATRFELVLHGSNPVALRAAGESALDEIERLEASLSLYRPSSEIAHVNARAAHEPVPLSVPVFRLLQEALRLSQETGGAFDITVGPLMRCWGFMAEAGRIPSPDELTAARALVGWQHIELDPIRFTIRLTRPGMLIDLGAIGKGYAIDSAVDLLREAGVDSALLHGGTSSIYALGHPPEAEAWTIAVQPPVASAPPTVADAAINEIQRRPAGVPQGVAGKPASAFPERFPEVQLPTFRLCNRALSVSAVWGKSFQSADHRYGHVIDPRTGQPTSRGLLAAVALTSTTETDALSTALLTLGPLGVSEIRRLHPEATCMVVHGSAECPEVTGNFSR